MTQRHILVVDDEPINLEIISEFLADDGYDLDLVESADIAWQRMQNGGRAYDLLILDRMMPGMSGLELLKIMKADERFRAIPVIMQTAACTQDQIREGVEAGAYYYLPKPYAPETLSAIVRAALLDVAGQEAALQRVSAHVRAMDMLDQATFRFRALAQIGPLIEVLTSICPDPQKVAVGLTELLVNAVEHGNLGLSYEDKKRLRLENGWEAEVARRQALPEYGDRSVRVWVARHPNRIEFMISDEGEGFDWRRYLDFDPERMADPNGRGIAMARLLSFSQIEYIGSGNSVVATILLSA